MSDERERAAAMLSEIERRREGAVERMLVPSWFWWAIGLGMVIVGWVADGGNATAIAVTAVAFGIVAAVMTFAAVFGVSSGARVRSDLMGPRGAVAIIALVGVTLCAAFAVAFGSRAAGWMYPATLGTATGAVVLVVGGPRLMGYLRRTMLRAPEAGR